MMFGWKYGDLAAWAEPPENKVCCTVFQATLCQCLAVRQGWMSLVTSVPFLSLSEISSHAVYHLHISFHGTQKAEVNSGSKGATLKCAVKFSDVGTIIWCCHIGFSSGEGSQLSICWNYLPWSFFMRPEAVLIAWFWLINSYLYSRMSLMKCINEYWLSNAFTESKRNCSNLAVHMCQL